MNRDLSFLILLLIPSFPIHIKAHNLYCNVYRSENIKDTMKTHIKSPHCSPYTVLHVNYTSLKLEKINIQITKSSH